MALVAPNDIEESPSPVPRRKTFPRKGHTKSRKGCFNCKRRKIKCQEVQPSCSNCVKADLECQYPDVASRWAIIPTPVMQPQTTPTMFSMDDMKLFHHFIVRAYPHLPIGADTLWKVEIPAWAHQHDFLIHSMLALAASHLSMNALGDYKSAALQHRVIAVRLLNESLSRDSTTQMEADAKLAACLALTFQSSYMEDGFLEFLTMIRGCALVTRDHPLEQPTSAFHCFSGENHRRIMQQHMRKVLPPAQTDPTILDQALHSLQAVAPLCINSREKEFQQILYGIVQQTYHSPLQAYFTFCASYNWPSKLEHGEFAALISTTNQVGHILLSHFVALQLLQQCTTVFVWSDRDTASPAAVVVAWLKRLDSSLKPEYKQYNAWPRHFGQTFEAFAANGEMKVTIAPYMVRSTPMEILSNRDLEFDFGNVTQLLPMDPDMTTQLQI